MLEVSCPSHDLDRETEPFAAFISASSYLGHEYVRLGKTSRAGLVFAQAEARLATAAAFPAAHVLYYTLYAEYLAVIGNHDRR